MRLYIPLSDDRHPRIGFRERGATGQPPGDHQNVCLIRAIRIGLQRHPDIRRRIRLEPWRQDADECVGCAAQGYRLAQYRRITPEPPLPQTITHEENLRPARPVLHLGERAPEDWLRPEQPEITARDVDPLHKLRPVSTTQIEAAGDEIVSRQVLEERIVLLPIGEHRYGV